MTTAPAPQTGRSPWRRETSIQAEPVRPGSPRGTRTAVISSPAARLVRERAGEEVRRGDGPLAVGPGDDRLAVEREQRGGQLGRRVREGDAADDGAAAAHGRVRDVPARLGEQRRLGADDVRELGGALARERADPHGAVLDRDAVEALDAVDVHDHGRRRQARVHQADEALAAGEDAGVTAVPGQMVDRLRDGAWRDVVERSRFQRVPPMVSPRLRRARRPAGPAFQNHL